MRLLISLVLVFVFIPLVSAGNCNPFSPYYSGEQACNPFTCHNCDFIGQKRCVDSSYIQVCADDNNDGCMDWSIYDGEICPYGCSYYTNECVDEGDPPGIDGVPPSGCAFDCDTSETICTAAGNLVRCSDSDGDGCNDFMGEPYERCPFGCTYRSDTRQAFCKASPDVCDYRCTPGTQFCLPDGYHYTSCVDNDNDGCYEADTSWGNCEYGCTSVTSGIECATSPAASCNNSCFAGRAYCMGVYPRAEYSVECVDSDNDGCDDLKSVFAGESSGAVDYCDYGCDDYSGLCYNQPTRGQNTCSAGTYSCIADHPVEEAASSEHEGYYAPGFGRFIPHEYSGTISWTSYGCSDGDGDGYREFDIHNATYCPYQCNPSTGRCQTGYHVCSTGESTCIGSLPDEPEYPGTEARSGSGYFGCGDMNGDGYREWDVFNHTSCLHGCWEDTDNSTGLLTAHCYSDFDEQYEIRNAIEEVAGHVSVAFPTGIIRFILSVIFFAIAFGVGTVLSRTPAFGGICGIGTIGLCMYYGWIPIYFTVGIIALASFLIFKGFMGGEVSD